MLVIGKTTEEVFWNHMKNVIKKHVKIIVAGKNMIEMWTFVRKYATTSVNDRKENVINKRIIKIVKYLDKTLIFVETLWWKCKQRSEKNTKVHKTRAVSVCTEVVVGF